MIKFMLGVGAKYLPYNKKNLKKGKLKILKKKNFLKGEKKKRIKMGVRVKSSTGGFESRCGKAKNNKVMMIESHLWPLCLLFLNIHFVFFFTLSTSMSSPHQLY